MAKIPDLDQGVNLTVRDRDGIRPGNGARVT